MTPRLRDAILLHALVLGAFILGYLLGVLAVIKR